MSTPDISTSFEYNGKNYGVEWFNLPQDKPLPDIEWQQIYAVGNYKGKVPVVHYPNAQDNLPGGKVEHGETPEIALHREIEEELNMRVISWFPIGYQRVESPDGQKVNQLRCYAIMEKIGEFMNDPGGNITGHRLVEIDKLNDTIGYGLIGERMVGLVRDKYPLL